MMNRYGIIPKSLPFATAGIRLTITADRSRVCVNKADTVNDQLHTQ
ncbi:MAG: hypothetical protein ACLR8P_11525 [Clostridium fessum]